MLRDRFTVVEQVLFPVPCRGWEQKLPVRAMRMLPKLFDELHRGRSLTIFPRIAKRRGTGRLATSSLPSASDSPSPLRRAHIVARHLVSTVPFEESADEPDRFLLSPVVAQRDER